MIVRIPIVVFSLLCGAVSAHATTRYIDSTAGACTGNYSIASRNCSGSDGNSYATITAGLAATSAGDTLYIRAGTYAETMINTIPAGTSDSVRTVVSAYNGETVTVLPASGIRVLNIIGRSYISVIGLTLNGVNVDYDVVKIEPSSNYIILEGNDIKNAQATANLQQCILVQSAHNGIIRNNSIHDCGTTTLEHGIYLNNGNDWLIERNRIYNNSGQGASIYAQPKRATIQYNHFYNNCRDQSSGAQVVLAHQDHIFQYNKVTKTSGGCNSQVVVQYQTPTRSIIRQNSIYCHSACVNGIYLASDVTSTVVQNNIVRGATTQINNLGTGTTLTTNLTTGTATDIWTDPATHNLTLKAGSAAIDAGTAIGLSYNGSAPDQGAHETFTFASCEVPSDSTSSIHITFNNNLYPPLQTPTTFTARKNGSSNVLSGAATVVGDNVVSLPLTDSYAGGDTAYISWSSGSLSDSALIGGTANQPFVTTLTDQSCTNNAAGAPSFTLTQADFEYHGVYGLEANPDVRGAENATTYTVVKGGAARIRLSVVCGVADCASVGLYLYYAQGGSYAIVPNEFDSGNIAFCGSTYTGPLIPSNGAVTTNQLSTSGTFVAGGVIFSSQATPTVTLATGNKTELEYCVKFDTDATGDYTFRLYTQEDAALDTYSHTPTVTMVATQANMP